MILGLNGSAQIGSWTDQIYQWYNFFKEKKSFVVLRFSIDLRDSGFEFYLGLAVCLWESVERVAKWKLASSQIFGNIKEGFYRQGVDSWSLGIQIFKIRTRRHWLYNLVDAGKSRGGGEYS
jgi:hypothetical protein